MNSTLLYYQPRSRIYAPPHFSPFQLGIAELVVSEPLLPSWWVLFYSAFIPALKSVCLWFRSDEVQAMMEKLKQEEEKLKKAENTIAVMTMLKEGTVPETVSTAGEHCREKQNVFSTTLDTVLEISGCPRQLKLRSGNQFSAKIKCQLPEIVRKVP